MDEKYDIIHEGKQTIMYPRAHGKIGREMAKHLANIADLTDQIEADKILIESLRREVEIWMEHTEQAQKELAQYKRALELACAPHSTTSFNSVRYYLDRAKEQPCQEPK